MNVISKRGLINRTKGKSADVKAEALRWLKVAQSADWDSFEAVRQTFTDADLVDGLLVFNIRGNRFRLIVYPFFPGRTLYVKALLTHQEYDAGEWKE